MSDDTVTRRDVMQVLGAGLLLAVGADELLAQPAATERRPGTGERGDQRGGARPPQNIAARIHLGADGTITVMCGKVEGGQGARAQVTQAAAEELRVSPDRIRVVMGDTDLCPDDGPTVGSHTTSRTIPAVRRGSIAARELLVALAAKRWNADNASSINPKDGKLTLGDRTIGYRELAGDEWLKAAASTAVKTDGVEVTAVENWTTLGTTLNRPNGRDIVVGTHQYPSDIHRPGMLYGKVLRAPRVGSTLASIDLAAAPMSDGTIIVHEGEFVAVAAKRSTDARRAIEQLAKSATWKHVPQVSDAGLFAHLEQTAKDKAALGMPTADSASSITADYHVAYVQHVPLEPRAAVAEWEGDKLTVWTATQNPFRVRQEVSDAMKVAQENVRVIVPDFGGAFGGKHTGECAIEAARLARAAKRPVSLRWTREEEFQWASFRPAALIRVHGAVRDGGLTAWQFVNVNSGGSGLSSPYRCDGKREQYVESNAPPLRHGSYRALASTANHFARESMMDELAHLAGDDPLAFRLRHLQDERLSNVLKAAAEGFGWNDRFGKKDPSLGVGLACGIEKGSYVAACVEVAISGKDFRVTRIRQAYECGKIMNPSNLLAQVQGAIIQGLGPALREEVVLDDGKVTNGRLSAYAVPRFSDVPAKLEIDLIDRPDLPSIGAGETPIIAVAPAIANALFHATGQRVRMMPIRLS